MVATVIAAASCTGAAAQTAPTPAAEVWAFHAPWDARSDSSAVRHRAAIDVLVSGWIALDTADGRPLHLFRDTLARGGDRATRSAALVTSWLGDRFHPETIRGLAADPAALARTAGGIARHAAAMRYQGLVLDFELHERADLPALLRVTRAIADSARSAGVREIVMAIPATDTLGYPARPLLDVVDRLLVMLYDEHWSTSPPGPVASPAWVRGALAMRVAEAGASRLIAALPTYGYLWQPGAAAAETIGFADARRLADRTQTPLGRDAASSTLRLRDPAGVEAWVSDAGLLRDLIAEADRLGVSTLAVWRLGLEDPDVWPLLARP